MHPHTYIHTQPCLHTSYLQRLPYHNTNKLTYLNTNTILTYLNTAYLHTKLHKYKYTQKSHTTSNKPSDRSLNFNSSAISHSPHLTRQLRSQFYTNTWKTIHNKNYKINFSTSHFCPNIDMSSNGKMSEIRWPLVRQAINAAEYTIASFQVLADSKERIYKTNCYPNNSA